MSDVNDYLSDLGSTSAGVVPGTVDSYVADLTPKRKAVASTVFGKDVAGAPLLDQSPQTQAAVMADIRAGGDGSGKPATYNGAALNAFQRAPPSFASGNQGRGSINPPLASSLPPTEPTTALPSIFGPMGDVANLAIRGVGGAANAAIGGYKGLYQLAAGNGLDAAVNATRSDTIPIPSATGPTAQMEGALASNANPANWVPKIASMSGEELASAGYPGLGTALTTAGAAVPLIAGGLAGRAGRAESVAANEAGAAERTITPTDTLKAGQSPPASETAARAQALSDVGFTQARDAAVNGDNRTRAVEYQMGKFAEPAGEAAAKQFQDESDTMSARVKGMIGEAGGTVGTDQSTLYSRGQTQVKPIQALRDWFDAKASDLYKAADGVAQGQPVSLGGFSGALADDSNITQPSHVLMRNAASAFAQKAGMTVGEDGALNGTALQAETVRKWMNQKAKQDPTGALTGYVDALKDAMDDDVAKSAGGPIYDQARQLWAQRQATIADPKGISSLLDEDASGRKIPLEKVPDKIASMDQDQFSHIVGTLQNMPPELQSVGNAALGEIKSHFYNQMLDGATETRGGNARPFWNGTAVKNVISDNSGKLATLLSPEEAQSLIKLKDAGDVLSFDPSYPGAAAQAQNAVKQGLMASVVGKGITGAGALVGSSLGPVGTAGGAAVGQMMGNKAQTAIAERQALSAWNKKSTDLRGLLKP